MGLGVSQLYAATPVLVCEGRVFLKILAQHFLYENQNQRYNLRHAAGPDADPAGLATRKSATKAEKPEIPA